MDQSMERKVGREEGTRGIPGNLGGRKDRRNSTLTSKYKSATNPQRERERDIQTYSENVLEILKPDISIRYINLRIQTHLGRSTVGNQCINRSTSQLVIWCNCKLRLFCRQIDIQIYSLLFTTKYKYDVQQDVCIFYNVQRTLYNVYRTLYVVQCSMYIVHYRTRKQFFQMLNLYTIIT